MKKTQRKDAVRNIRKRIVSHLSVCLVIMLGLGGFFVTRYMQAGLEKEATKYYADRNFKDYELISSLGISDEDLAQIKETKGVTDAEGAIRTEATLASGATKQNIELITMTERISVPEVVEGKAPAASNECMIGEDFSSISGLKVGDKVRITMPEMSSADDYMPAEEEKDDEEASADGEEADEEAQEEEPSSPLYEEEFVITGLMKHPDYLRRKSINTVAIPLAAVDADVTGGYFTHAFVKTAEPEGTGIFSEEFFDKTAGTTKDLEKLTETLEVDSAERAKKKAYARIDEQWEEALAELEESQAEIDNGEATLDSELAKARADLNDAQKELNGKVKASQKEIRAAEAKIKKAKSNMKKIDKKLPEAKKYIKKMKKYYEGSLEDDLNELIYARTLLNKLDRLDPDSEEFKKAVKELAEFIYWHEDMLNKIQAFCKKDAVMEAAKELKKLTGLDATGVIKAIRKIDVSALCGLAWTLSEENDGDIKAFIKDTEAAVRSLEQELSTLKEYSDYIKEYEASRKDLKKQIAKKEKQVKAAKKKLAAQKKKYQAKINHGWSLYYSRKSAYETKLQEAKELLAENRELAEQKLEEAKAEVEKIDCTWLLFDRRGNAGYMDVRATMGALTKAGIIFGVLFLLISGMVCLSTLAIIIEEQKKLVGTVKAFGFFKKEILGKYLTFGLTAAIAGSVTGTLLAVILSNIVLKKYDEVGMYQFGQASTVMTVWPTIIACLGMIAVCALSTVIACSDILKSPASVLMKGGTEKKEKKKKTGKSKKAGKGGTLYSRLIIRNMLDDKARVLISILIIAFSTLLVGTGISMKLANDGMTKKQIADIHTYDVKVSLGEKVTDEDKAEIEKTMSAEGAEFMAASYETHIYRWDGRLDALNVLTGDPEKLGDYFAVTDPKTGERLALPEDGILVQKKMKESYKMVEGTKITMLDSALDERTGIVKGAFQNYVGRIVITSPEGYKSVFKEDPVYNCYYVKAGSADISKLEGDLLAVCDDISFELDDDFASKFGSLSILYDIIVYLTTGIAIIMSFLILTNLANIFLNRKKTELTVMRINGFSIKQTKGYLSRETVLTTLIGIVAGVLVGAGVTPVLIKLMEQPDVQFVRTFHPAAWIAAVVLEGLFALIIYSLVFRKVKDLDFRDIA